MTLELFKNIVLDLYDNEYFTEKKILSRAERLKKNKQNPTSLKGILYRKHKICMNEFEDSIIRTHGELLQKAGNIYAETRLNSKPLKKNVMKIKIDILFKIRKIFYNLESKININLDSGKSNETLENLNRKHKAITNGFQCKVKRTKVISKILVWTAATAKDAADVAKFPLEEKHLMGSEEFFKLFDEDIKHEDFLDMITELYHNHLKPKIINTIRNNSSAHNSTLQTQLQSSQPQLQLPQLQSPSLVYKNNHLKQKDLSSFK